MDPLERLTRLAPPPSAPHEALGSWDEVERELSSPLPEDYKRLVERYGSGVFSEHVRPFNPFSSIPYVNLVGQAFEIAEAWRPHREMLLESVPGGLFPETGGLLPWGNTTNFGEYLSWKTDGPPERWPVVFWASRDGVTETHPMTATAFLSAWLGGELPSTSWLSWDSKGFRPEFEQYRKRESVSVFVRHPAQSFAKRLELLMGGLGVRRVRSRHDDENYSQIRFVAGSLDLEVTHRDNGLYGTASMDLLYAAPDEAAVKAAVLELCDRLGWEVWRIQDARGNPVW